MALLQALIFLIDDDEDDLEILSPLLESPCIKVRTFNSGEKAVFYMQLLADIEGHPSLIILDYNMPRINGEQLLLLIKNNGNTRHIPVVMYSTSMSLVLRKALIDLGAHDCFVKPSTYSETMRHAELFKSMACSFNSSDHLIPRQSAS
jgi:CheY-like chemotaxis protein